MKKKAAELILPVFITISFTFLVQYFGNLLTAPNGVYTITNISTNSESFGIIQLENKSNKTQNDLKFLIEGTNTINVESTNYVDYKIEISKTDSTICLLNIFNQLPHTKNKLILSGLRNDTKISFANDDERNYLTNEKLVDRQLNSLRNALITTSIYGLVFGLFYVYFMYRFNQSIDKRDLQSKSLKQDISKLKEDTDGIRKSHIKYRLILMSKVRDYEKELNFWKTTVSKILLEDKSTNPKKLFKKITEELKTYGTRDFKDGELKMAEYIDKITKND